MPKTVGIKFNDSEYDEVERFASDNGYRAPSDMCRHATRLMMKGKLGIGSVTATAPNIPIANSGVTFYDSPAKPNPLIEAPSTAFDANAWAKEVVSIITPQEKKKGKKK